MKYKNALYFQHINTIGGVETMFYELARKYRDWDITIFYCSGSDQQIARLRKYVRVVRIPEDVRNGSVKISCEKVFFNYAMAINWFDFDESYQIIHADLRQQGIKANTDERLTGYIAVSQTVADSFEALTGIKPVVCYNPIEIDESDYPTRLNLISATRLTAEKGKDRMIRLARELNNRGILFRWDIFTNDFNEIKEPNVYYHEPKLNILPEIADADLLVQLSDSEGWCYSVNESLCIGTPVLATKCPSIYEMAGKTIFLDFNFENIEEVIVRLKKLIEKKENLKKKYRIPYEPRTDIWNKLLVKGKSAYRKEQDMKYIVKATKEFEKVTDSEVNRVRQQGEEFIVTQQRLDQLENFHFAGRKVKLVDVLRPAEEPEAKPEAEKKPQKKEKAPAKIKTSEKKKTARKSQKKS